jgi:hypothetical protein
MILQLKLKELIKFCLDLSITLMCLHKKNLTEQVPGVTVGDIIQQNIIKR